MVAGSLSIMPPAADAADFDRQLEQDHDSLGLVVPGITRLDMEWQDARVAFSNLQRGYFTPDEDDWARRLILTYRNSRQSLWEIIYRYERYSEVADPSRQLRAFLLCIGSGLTLMSKSLKLIQAYERVPLVRAKLNEPDARFGLEAGFFDEILRAYTSLGNYHKFGKALWFWRSRRRQIQRLVETRPDEWRWLVELIRTERKVVGRRLGQVLWSRLRYDWSAFWRTTFAPVRKTRYGLQSLIAGACSGIRTTLHYQPGLTPGMLRSLRPLLRPGDVLLIRAERKLTSAILPGFWAHSALFIGGEQDLVPLGLAGHPHCEKHLGTVQEHSAGLGSVIEAVAPRVRINALEKSLHADHVAVLRPALPESDFRAAIADAFSHLGKPYDYEFDFNVTTRLVCTEIIYRIYHNRGAIRFPLTRRVGRYTLTGDDIAGLVLNTLASSSDPKTAPFQIISLALKIGAGDSQIIPSNDAPGAMRRLLEGWRPAKMKKGGED